jgi:hypothetical protein
VWPSTRHSVRHMSVVHACMGECGGGVAKGFHGGGGRTCQIWRRRIVLCSIGSGLQLSTLPVPRSEVRNGVSESNRFFCFRANIFFVLYSPLLPVQQGGSGKRPKMVCPYELGFVKWSSNVVAWPSCAYIDRLLGPLTAQIEVKDV